MINSSIEELFNSIENSSLYKKYKQMSDILSKDKDIKKLIDEIKMLEKIRIENAKITATFNSESLVQIMDLIQMTSLVNYTIKDKVVYLSGK